MEQESMWDPSTNSLERISTSKANGSSKNLGLAALRGLAALMILAHHLKGYGNRVYRSADLLSWISPACGYAVYLFFCLSGYWLAAGISRVTSARKFLVKRALRIYPGYHLAVVLVVLAHVFITGNYSNPNMIKAVTLLPMGQIIYPLNIEWTLVYEVCFYIICALFASQQRKEFFPYFLIIWTVIIVSAQVFFAFETSTVLHWNTFIFSNFNLCFISGTVVYNLKARSKFHPPRVVRYITLILLFVLFFAINNIACSYPSIIPWRLYIYAVLCAAMVYFASFAEIKPTNLLVRAGDYSYGIYLVHAQILFWVYTIFKDRGYTSANTGIVIAALALSLIGSWFYGKFDVILGEKLRAIQGKLPPNLKRNVILFLVSTGVIITALAIGGNVSNQASPAPIVSEASTVSKPLENGKSVEAGPFIAEKIAPASDGKGWADFISATQISKGESIILRGWAIDLKSLGIPDRVIAVNNGKILPGSYVWSERKAIAELYKNDAYNHCGWTLELPTDTWVTGKLSLEIYAVTRDGSYIKLQTKEEIVIEIS